MKVMSIAKTMHFLLARHIKSQMMSSKSKLKDNDEGDSLESADKQEVGALPPPPFLITEGERKPGKSASRGRRDMNPTSFTASTHIHRICLALRLRNAA